VLIEKPTYTCGCGYMKGQGLKGYWCRSLQIDEGLEIADDEGVLEERKRERSCKCNSISGHAVLWFFMGFVDFSHLTRPCFDQSTKNQTKPARSETGTAKKGEVARRRQTRPVRSLEESAGLALMWRKLSTPRGFICWNGCWCECVRLVAGSRESKQRRRLGLSGLHLE